MHIILQPVAGASVITALIDDIGLTVNGSFFAWDALPIDGPLRLDGDTVTIDYGEEGGVSTGCLTKVHSMRVVPSNWADPNPPAYDLPDPVLAARVNLEALRQGWVCDRWQIKTVLGQERWETILAFGANPYASWGLKTLIDDAMQIPRVSETVEVLAYILGLSDEEVDDLFRTAMALTA